jgi:hypothetical protein
MLLGRRAPGGAQRADVDVAARSRACSCSRGRCRCGSGRRKRAVSGAAPRHPRRRRRRSEEAREPRVCRGWPWLVSLMRSSRRQSGARTNRKHRVLGRQAQRRDLHARDHRSKGARQQRIGEAATQQARDELITGRSTASCAGEDGRAMLCDPLARRPWRRGVSSAGWRSNSSSRRGRELGDLTVPRK